MRLRIEQASLARRFFFVLLATFALIAAFAIRLIYQFSNLSAEGDRLIRSLEQTSALNHRLGQWNRAQIDQLHRQFETPDPDFPAKQREDSTLLAEKYTEYLKLNIGDEERLSIVRIKSLHSELSVVSAQIVDLLVTGNREQALERMRQVNQLAAELRDEFEILHGFQVKKLQSVIEHLNRSASGGYIAVYVLAGALLVVLIASSLIFQARILRPVRSILDASGQIRLGDFSARAVVSSADEMGRLAQGFNFMAESLAASYHDLTCKVEERTKQLQEMQEHLIQAEKMSAVGQLVSGVAHELNNPLSAIMGFAEIARMKSAAAGADASQLEALQEIASQAERCRKIVSNLLQFVRREMPHLEAIHINEVVDQVLKLREYELHTRNVNLVRDFDPANPLICADPQKIQQVVLNLLNNANDAILEAGTSGNIWVRTRAYADQITLEVRDDGPGIKSPQRVFEPFYTTKELGKGTGLGLSVCYGIIKEHGGEIVAHNCERGARLLITLPIGDPEMLKRPRKERSPDAESPIGHCKARALVVDDEKPLVRMQVALLSRMGIEADGATTGEEAIRYLESHSVDVVISDVRMPGHVNGIQLYQWIQKNKPQLAERVLFVSGDVVRMNPDDPSEDIDVPCIHKPFKFEEYSRIVAGILERGGTGE